MLPNTAPPDQYINLAAATFAGSNVGSDSTRRPRTAASSSTEH